MNCPHCGRDIPIAEDQHFCQFCGARLDSRGEPDTEGRLQQALGAVSESGETEGDATRPRDGYCPWEDQERLGLLVGMYRTVKESLLAPEAFFSMIPVRGGFVSPLLYAMIVGTVGAMASSLWGFAFENPIMSEAARTGSLTIIGGVLIPMIVLLGIVLSAIMLHGALLVIGGANERFEATFRVVCYTSVGDLFSVIPIVGGLVGLACKLYLTLVGLKAVHRISTGKAAVAIMLPLLVVCAVGVLAVMTAIVSLGTGAD